MVDKQDLDSTHGVFLRDGDLISTQENIICISFPTRAIGPKALVYLLIASFSAAGVQAQGISSVSQPSLRDLDAQNIDRELKSLVRRLADHEKIFRLGHARVNELSDPYRFVFYDRRDPAIRPLVHQAMALKSADGEFSHEAVTDRSTRKVYVVPERIRTLARRHRENESKMLLRTLVNELVHTLSTETTYVVSKEKALQEFAEIAFGGPTTFGEKQFQALLTEEIVSETVAKVIARRWKEPNYALAARDLGPLPKGLTRSELKALDARTENYQFDKPLIASVVFRRVFTGAIPPHLPRSADQKAAEARAAEFVQSDELAAKVIARLREFDLVIN